MQGGQSTTLPTEVQANDHNVCLKDYILQAVLRTNKLRGTQWKTVQSSVGLP